MNHYRELEVPDFESIQTTLISYVLTRYPGLYQFWNHVDQDELHAHVPALRPAIQQITGQTPLKTYLLVVPNGPEHMVNARLGGASLHSDTSVESTRLNWPVLNGTSIETRLFTSTAEPAKITLPTGETYLTYREDQCTQVGSFYMTRPTLLHVHTIHGLYRAAGPLPRYILSFNFEHPIEHLLN